MTWRQDLDITSLYGIATGIRRLSDLLDALFSLEWAAEVDSRVFHSIYYLSLSVSRGEQ